MRSCWKSMGIASPTWLLDQSAHRCVQGTTSRSQCHLLATSVRIHCEVYAHVHQTVLLSSVCFVLHDGIFLMRSRSLLLLIIHSFNHSFCPFSHSLLQHRQPRLQDDKQNHRCRSSLHNPGTLQTGNRKLNCR